MASFSITTTNTGKVAASDATLVYVAPQNISSAAPHPRPVRQLVEFVRTPVLVVGTSHTESVHLFAEAFAMMDWRGRSVAHSGTYSVIFDNGDGARSVLEVTIAQDIVVDVLPPPPSLKRLHDEE